ncbi:hypothetical protein Ahy_A03g012366 isoform B [Arachis hypogaea]|uniref:Uncharacterized protein n=1 Tax=Arachis hypogaea TaxID=3818 RepID=A0A445DTA6_ARAHY|nr:hypothetical protein Ahy_A03g012366 isoform B [Arachis hypogaea]
MEIEAADLKEVNYVEEEVSDEFYKWVKARRNKSWNLFRENALKEYNSEENIAVINASVDGSGQNPWPRITPVQNQLQITTSWPSSWLYVSDEQLHIFSQI